MVASSFPITQTVAPEKQADLIDGEESIEPKVQMAVRALKDYSGGDYANVVKKYADGNNQFSTIYGFSQHRILFNAVNYYNLGVIPVCFHNFF